MALMKRSRYLLGGCTVMASALARPLLAVVFGGVDLCSGGGDGGARKLGSDAAGTGGSGFAVFDSVSVLLPLLKSMVVAAIFTAFSSTSNAVLPWFSRRFHRLYSIV